MALKAAISICEDVWVPKFTQDIAAAGAQILFNMNASPYHKNKLSEREEIISQQAADSGLYIVYTNLVGGQDELVFDGNSMVIDDHGKRILHAPQFIAGLYNISLDLKSPDNHSPINLSLPSSTEEENIYDALVLGVRDYVRKNNFKGAVIGLSGGNRFSTHTKHRCRCLRIRKC